MDERSRTRRGIAWPVAHLLALAPLDVWVGMLAGSGGVQARYWLRLAFCLFTSAVGTVLTLPERAVLWVVRRVKFGGDAPTFEHGPGVVVVLGYYRSGTTHLHNLLACDRRVVTPRWYQCLAGQGWWGSWAVVRFMLTPFLGSTRPQDGVGFGPAWPAEDDFALATWGGASTLAGRFVFPAAWGRERAWHGLEGLDGERLRQWRSLTAMFCWKVTRGRPGDRRRVLVLKTPSHTARVAELDRLFAGRVRFVSIERDRGAVVASNVKMHAALGSHALQDGLGEAALRARIEGELDEMLAKRDRELEGIDSARVVRVRYEELVADPMGVMGRVSDGMGLAWDRDAQDRVAAYLHRVGRYRDGADLAALPPDPEPWAGERRTGRAVAAGFGVALACAAVWLGLVWALEEAFGWGTRLDGLAWVSGGVIGLAVARAGRVGSAGLGVLAVGLTLTVFWGTTFPIELITDNWWGGMGNPEQWWIHNRRGAVAGVTHSRAVLFTVLAVVTAWRQASRVGPRAPGT